MKWLFGSVILQGCYVVVVVIWFYKDDFVIFEYCVGENLDNMYKVIKFSFIVVVCLEEWRDFI